MVYVAACEHRPKPLPPRASTPQHAPFAKAEAGSKADAGSFGNILSGDASSRIMAARRKLNASPAALPLPEPPKPRLALPRSSFMNTVLLRSAAKFHVRLQRQRQAAFLYATNAPDDITTFKAAVEEGFASPHKFIQRRKTDSQPPTTVQELKAAAASQGRVPFGLRGRSESRKDMPLMTVGEDGSVKTIDMNESRRDDDAIESRRDEEEGEASTPKVEKPPSADTPRTEEEEFEASEGRDRVSRMSSEQMPAGLASEFGSNRSLLGGLASEFGSNRSLLGGLASEFGSNRSLVPPMAAVKVSGSSEVDDEASDAPQVESPSLRSSLSARKRVSGRMQLSAEMGQEEAKPVLPDNVVGSFSCHGVDRDLAKINQDCACIAFPLEKDDKAALFIVLDGHGKQGHTVSAEALSILHSSLDEFNWADETKNEAQLISAFEGTEEKLKTFALDRRGFPAAHSSGAVGVALLLRQGVLWVAHVGDCRAVLGREDSEGAVVAVALTEDHTPDKPKEGQRIEAAGAYIRPETYDPCYAPARIYHSEKEPWRGPGLAMSRCLGDLDAVPAGIVPTPEVTSRKLQPEDKFVVLASDGLWEFLPNDDVVECVNGFMNRGESAIKATRFLIAKAALAWRLEEGDYRDDITVIVIYLKGLPANLGV
ncbi:hypothetical protein AB1Y20_018495 [Prymnesium parvum]|uniref:PPM-type phosphatase domain-containing protein n=1 Tax=Prymnesium parvum TaxID=97485 RepID=A0AB34JNG6_PRYPA